MPDFSGLGYASEGFEPIGSGPMAARQWLATQLRAVAGLSAWEHYAEPPEQLTGGPAVVVAPRSPYFSWGSYQQLQAHLTVHLMVPRAHGPAMDLLDTALSAVFEELKGIPDADIGTVDIGLLDDVGTSTYIVATVEVDLIGGDL